MTQRTPSDRTVLKYQHFLFGSMDDACVATDDELRSDSNLWSTLKRWTRPYLDRLDETLTITSFHDSPFINLDNDMDHIGWMMYANRERNRVFSRDFGSCLLTDCTNYDDLSFALFHLFK